MPFITQERRDMIGALVLNGSTQPGDLCYIHYKKMVDQWKANPRWTTAHEIYKDLIFGPVPEGLDNEAAKELAWQVFFQLHVMPYEENKRKLNGDI